jgi:RNA polymerase sigma-70 factor (ECF subfamily)
VTPQDAYEAYSRILFRYLYRLTGDGDAAEDAMHEAFTRFLQRPPGAGRERAWLFQVATNYARTLQRVDGNRLRLLREKSDQVPRPEQPLSPALEYEQTEAADRMRAALSELQDRDREILLMRGAGFSHSEIADAIGTTTGSVGTMLARALHKLARRLPLDRETV